MKKTNKIKYTAKQEKDARKIIGSIGGKATLKKIGRKGMSKIGSTGATARWGKKQYMAKEKQDIFGESEEDFKERVEKFSAELTPLMGKYELGMAAMPEITPQGLTIARPIFVSTRKAPEGAKAEEKSVEDKGGLSE